MSPRQVSRDAIVLPVHVHDVFSPALHTLARVIAEAMLGLSDEELSVVLGIVPGVERDLSETREIARALVAGESMVGLLTDSDVLERAARWIAGLSAKAPVVVVVDDVNGASPSLLHVIAQLATLSMPKRVMVVGSVRAPFEGISPFLVRLLETLEELGLLDRITLPPLDARDVDELLERMRIAPRKQLGRRLLELTAGNPLLLAELLAAGPLERVVSEWTSPPRVRDLARRRTAELGRTTAEILRHASLFERDFTIDLLAETTGTSVRTVATLIDRAVDAHILQPSTLHSYRFAHQLFRHTLAVDLSAARRADGHRRIAEALERRSESPALLAAHWSAASGDVAAKVFANARAAGRESMQILEPHEAVSWFELALASLVDDADRGTLLTELAEAQMFAGDPKCVATLQEAVDLALASGDDALVLQIVRATTPGWSTLPGVGGPETRRLLARALEIADDPATRSRALARLAVDVALYDAAAGERAGDEAVALASRAAISARCSKRFPVAPSLSLAPSTLETRRSAFREVLELTSSATDVVTRYFALSANVVTAIEAGDVTGADAWSVEADTIASQYELAPLRWSTLVRRAWRAGLSGAFERAEALVLEAWQFGEAHGIPHAPEAGRLQRGMLRWQQDRVGSCWPRRSRPTTSSARSSQGSGSFSRGCSARIGERHDEARRLLHDVAIDCILPAAVGHVLVIGARAERRDRVQAGRARGLRDDPRSAVAVPRPGRFQRALGRRARRLRHRRRRCRLRRRRGAPVPPTRRRDRRPTPHAPPRRPPRSPPDSPGRSESARSGRRARRHPSRATIPAERGGGSRARIPRPRRRRPPTRSTPCLRAPPNEDQPASAALVASSSNASRSSARAVSRRYPRSIASPWMRKMPTTSRHCRSDP